MTTTDYQNYEIDQKITEAIQLATDLKLTAEITGAWVWVKENLQDQPEIRKTLKAQGFKFAIKKKLWYFPAVPSVGRGGKSMNYIRSKYGSTIVRSAKEEN